MHNFVNKKTPISFTGLWITNEERNPRIDLRNVNNFYVPAHRLDLMKRSPLVSFAKHWNDAIEEKHNQNLHIFLKSLKKSFFTQLN